MTHAHAHAPDHDADPSIHKGQETRFLVLHKGQDSGFYADG